MIDFEVCCDPLHVLLRFLHPPQHVFKVTLTTLLQFPQHVPSDVTTRRTLLQILLDLHILLNSSEYSKTLQRQSHPSPSALFPSATSAHHLQSHPHNLLQLPQQVPKEVLTPSTLLQISPTDLHILLISPRNRLAPSHDPTRLALSTPTTPAQ